jgi:glycosyltransferase involved in cell wall biosynthesis
MRIAFISYEYPPDTADGGIATYVQQAAAMLQKRGHCVEVFAGSRTRDETRRENGVNVHRIAAGQNDGFREKAGAAFAECHRVAAFEVLEGPDYSADADEAVRRVPAIPLVVKLHTPSMVLLRLNYREHGFARRLRLAIRALRKGRRPCWGYDSSIQCHRRHVAMADARERAHAAQADEIVSPSKSLGELLAREWQLDHERIATVPYPYEPAPELLEIAPETASSVVTYLGRLEVRKGVLDLARAIPRVQRRHPKARFRFVGPADDSPLAGMDMRDYLRRELSEIGSSVEFPGAVAAREVPAVLAASDVCVFPSRWENFPCVCLEAMAAARGIVGSSAGGMSEMLQDGVSGVVVPPRSPALLARAIATLLDDPSRRAAMGSEARARLLARYSFQRVGELQEASYARAVARRRALGARRTS